MDSINTVFLDQAKALQTILDKQWVEPHFQAIVDLTSGQVLGFESLARFNAKSEVTDPLTLFSLADSIGQSAELDKLCIDKSINAIAQLSNPDLLFINILPDSLLNADKLFNLTEKAPDLLSGIVLELSERHPLSNINKLKETIFLLKKYGAQIAIDDLGAGYSGLKVWSELRPNFVKIDRHFVNNIHIDSVKREFVRSIIEIARGLECKVIAEGIETAKELETLQAMGITLGQGYKLHKPEKSPTLDKLFLDDKDRSIDHQSLSKRPSHTIETILQATITIPPDTRADVVNDIFKSQPNVHSIPVIDDKKPIGIVSRIRALELFSGRFSHSLYGHMVISKFMDSSPLIVDHDMTLEDVSKRITATSQDLNNDIIITKDEHYIGVSQVSALLSKITDSQIRYARYSNPLTLLPGSVPIHETLDDYLKKNINFRFAYCDIDNFKPYNDCYGYSRGDEIITRLSEILLSATSPQKDIIGHIGGDDFLIIFRSDDWESRAQNILELFESETKKFYKSEDLKQGGVTSKNRKGERVSFDLMSLSIGIVHPCKTLCHSHNDVASLAASAKQQAKAVKGNHLFVCQRRGPDHSSTEQIVEGID